MSSTATRVLPQFTIVRAALSRLTDLLAVINGSGKALVPAFARTYLNGTPDGVTVTARNDIAHLSWASRDFHASDAFRASVLGWQFRQLVGVLDGGTVQATVNTAERRLDVTSGNYAGRVPAETDEAEALAAPTIAAPAWTFTMARTRLMAAISAVRYAALRPDEKAGDRAALDGVLIEISETTLAVTASNSHRFAQSRSRVATAPGQTVRAQFTGTAIQALMATLTLSQSESVTLSGAAFEGDKWLVTGDEFALLVLPLGSVGFPNYDRILAGVTRYREQVVVSRGALLGALARVRLSSDPKLPRLTIGTAPDGLFDGLHVAASSADFGESQETVIGEGRVSFTIGFNPNYLAEALSAGSSERATLRFGAATLPVVLTDESEDLTVIHLVSPVNITA